MSSNQKEQETLSAKIIAHTISNLPHPDHSFNQYINQFIILSSSGDLTNWSKIKDAISSVAGDSNETS